MSFIRAQSGSMCIWGSDWRYSCMTESVASAAVLETMVPNGFKSALKDAKYLVSANV